MNMKNIGDEEACKTNARPMLIHTHSQVEERDSNVELLRLVCMLFIVIHHFIVNAIFKECCLEEEMISLTVTNISAIFVNGFLYIAVNCFVLISGYYGIHLKCKSLLNLYLTCALYGLIAYLIHLYVDDAHIGHSILYNSLFIFSHSKWWFVNAYVILLFLSPLLNTAIVNMNKRQLLFVILLLLVMQIYFGNFWQANGFDVKGYHAFNFVLIYVIGQYLHRYVSINEINCHRWANLGLYVICAFCWIGLTLLDQVYPLTHWSGWTYHNIFILGGALFFFCFMLSFHFQNRFVNWLATSVLSVYLVQDNAYLSTLIYGATTKYCSLLCVTLIAKWVYVVLISMSFFIIILLLDKIRYYTFKWFFGWSATKRMLYKCDKVFNVKNDENEKEC